MPEIKLRWNVGIQPENKRYEPKRVQFVIKKAQATGAEVEKAITHFMRKRYPEHETIAKIEIKEDIEHSVIVEEIQPYSFVEPKADRSIEDAFSELTLEEEEAKVEAEKKKESITSPPPATTETTAVEEVIPADSTSTTTEAEASTDATTAATTTDATTATATATAAAPKANKRRKRALQDPHRQLRVIRAEDVFSVPEGQQVLTLKLHITFFGPVTHMNTPTAYIKGYTAPAVTAASTPATTSSAVVDAAVDAAAATTESSSAADNAVAVVLAAAAEDNKIERRLIVDAGVNLFDSDFSKDLKAVIHRAFAAGINKMVLISTSEKNSAHSITLAKARKHSLFATVGIHPNEVSMWCTAPVVRRWLKLKQLAEENAEEVVAIGECGLDFKKEDAQRDWQIKWLNEQIKLAGIVHKPLMLHERMAHKEFVEVVSQPENLAVIQREKALINCFTGTAEELQTYVNLGFYIGVTGFICNDERGKHMREIIRQIPLDRMILGSDAPYLTPFNMPRPFPRRNEPAFLPHVLAKVAEYTERNLDEIAEITNRNVHNLFGI